MTLQDAFIIHGKNKNIEQLRVNKFPYTSLMGDWYTPHHIPSKEQQGDWNSSDHDVSTIKFSDEIWWEQLDKAGKHRPGKGASRKKRSPIRGCNRIDPKGFNGASYLWRGYGLLKPFSSHWQILAHSNSFIDQEAEGPVWLVTYFTKTLFTKAGIDLYVRETLSETLYREILQKLKSHHGEDPSTKELCELASDMFRIPHGNV